MFVLQVLIPSGTVYKHDKVLIPSGTVLFVLQVLIPSGTVLFVLQVLIPSGTVLKKKFNQPEAFIWRYMLCMKMRAKSEFKRDVL